MYPSQSGKKRYAVRSPGSVQFNGQQTASRPNPNQPWASQTGAGFGTDVPLIRDRMEFPRRTHKHPRWNGGLFSERRWLELSGDGRGNRQEWNGERQVNRDW
jgi:hypothetical protein